MRTLDGTRILITGAASGIGRAMAERFTAAGALVLLTDVDDVQLARTAESMMKAGRDVRAYHLDVTDPDEIQAVRDTIHADVGVIDVLVNNAGVVFGGPFLDVPLDLHRTTVDVNVLGPVMLTHAFLPDLIARPEAHLVNIASMVGLVGAPGASTYAASKWAVLGLSESLELELRRQGHGHVHVTTVCPSLIRTSLFAGAGPIRLIPWLTPDRVADLVAGAILRDAPTLRVPFMVKLVPALRAALPHRTFNALIEALGGTTVMDSWTGRQQGTTSERDAAYRPTSV
jgi:short-subunit dehydrogenase